MARQRVFVNAPPEARRSAAPWLAGLALLAFLGTSIFGFGEETAGPPPLAESAAPAATVEEASWSTAGRARQGRASWYGAELHGSPTASGEPFDMHARTAAHRNLPLGSYAQVRNLENDREVLVKINDRGPHRRGMMIDLSYAAAEDLGIVDAGSGRVEITPVEPAP
ncbi:MAG TPA: septal ring lytic transglycosylase RlpA family protein [Thermoanaerobaculia bacterium]